MTNVHSVAHCSETEGASILLETTKWIGCFRTYAMYRVNISAHIVPLGDQQTGSMRHKRDTYSYSIFFSLILEEKKKAF